MCHFTAVILGCLLSQQKKLILSTPEILTHISFSIHASAFYLCNFKCLFFPLIDLKYNSFLDKMVISTSSWKIVQFC
jgi:hypothetical protein